MNEYIPKLARQFGITTDIDNVFFSSDPHFDHGNYAGIRKFSSSKAMAEYISDQWGRRIHKHNATFFLLGDIFWNSKEGQVQWEEALRYLRADCRVRIIKGNHDKPLKKWYKDLKEKRNANKSFTEHEFDAVHVYEDSIKEIKVNQNKLVLCHYPLATFNNARREYCGHLFGHTHDPSTDGYDPFKERKMHVGVDAQEHFVCFSLREVYNKFNWEIPADGKINLSA